MSKKEGIKTHVLKDSKVAKKKMEEIASKISVPLILRPR